MKKLMITSIILGCFIIPSQAQFLMKSNSHILRAGDEHYFNIAQNVDPGLSGASVSWNFSQLEDKSTLTSYMYSAYSTPNSADIPEANTVLEEYDTKFYFKVSDGIIEQYGTVTKNNTITKYDKPFVKMIFPFNYGDQYSGEFSGSIEGNNNYKANFTGTFSLEADAYGTLILPGGITYHNVFRIKTIKEQCYNNKACNCATISYKWYSENVRYPLLTIIQSQNSKGIKTFRTAYYSRAENKDNDHDQTLRLGSENIEAKIYPNPFMDEFKLDYSIGIDSDVNIEIYDNSGRKVNSVYKQSQKAGSYSETFRKDDLGDQLGMFHIRIIVGEEVVSKTIIRGE